MEKLSVKDAMERLNVAETTIRRMIQRGDLPNAEKVDRKIWIPLSDIEAYEQRQSPAASETSSEPVLPSSLPSDAVQKSRESVIAKVQPVPEETHEAEEAEIVSEPKPKSVKQKSASLPEAHSTIAKPIDDRDDKTESRRPPERTATSKTFSEPATYSPGAVQTHGEHEQSFKWIVVQAGILSTTWLEEIFHSIRVALEKYKKKSFPQSGEK